MWVFYELLRITCNHLKSHLKIAGIGLNVILFGFKNFHVFFVNIYERKTQNIQVIKLLRQYWDK